MDIWSRTSAVFSLHTTNMNQDWDHQKDLNGTNIQRKEKEAQREGGGGLQRVWSAAVGLVSVGWIQKGSEKKAVLAVLPGGNQPNPTSWTVSHSLPPGSEDTRSLILTS